MRRAILTACVLAGLAAGCNVRPMPGQLLSARMLLETRRVRLSWYLEYRLHTLLASDISNDFYPLNLGSTEPVERILAHLYARDGLRKRWVDFAELPQGQTNPWIYVAPDGRKILYERPDVDNVEGKFPRAYRHDVRVYRVAIYNQRTGLRFLIDEFNEIFSVGTASYWRSDGQAVAFTTTTARPGGEVVSELVVLDSCGQVMLCSKSLPELAGLEFICFSPGGQRIAALRPVKAKCGGVSGGVLVEVDTEQQTVRDVGEISASLACKYVDRFETLVEWSDEGACSVRRQ